MRSSSGYKTDQIGNMRQRISFIRRNQSNNSFVNANAPDATVYECYAAVWVMGAGRESEQAARETSVLTRQFTCRYHEPVIDTTLILVWRGSEYDIEAIDDIDGMQAYMKIIATKRI